MPVLLVDLTVSLRKLLEAKDPAVRGSHRRDRMNALRRAEESAQAYIRSDLRRRRRALGLTQAQAAQLLGMSRLSQLGFDNEGVAGLLVGFAGPAPRPGRRAIT